VQNFYSAFSASPLLAAGCCCVSHAETVAFELIQDKVYTAAVSAAPAIDGDLIEPLTEPAQDGSADYVVVRNILRNMRD